MKKNLVAIFALVFATSVLCSESSDAALLREQIDRVASLCAKCIQTRQYGETFQNARADLERLQNLLPNKKHATKMVPSEENDTSAS